MLQFPDSVPAKVLASWRIDALVFGALLGIFAVLALTVSNGGPTGLDIWLALRIQAVPGVQSAMQLASDIGGGVYGLYIGPAIAAIVLISLRKWKLLILVAGLVVLHYVLISPKLFIVAYRPSPLLGVQGAGGLESFPSGHVEWATSFYGLMAYLIIRYKPSLRLPALISFAVIVGATMLARIALGRHWPVDTLAGLAVGLVAVRILMRTHHVIEWYGGAGPLRSNSSA